MKNIHIFSILAGLACLCLLPQKADAQWQLSVGAGADVNALFKDNQFAYDYRYSPGWGYAAGIGAGYQFTDWFTLKAELSAVSKNFRMTRSGDDGNIAENQDNLYVKLPVLASFSFGGERVRGFLNAGAYAGFQAYRKKTGLTKGIVAGAPEVIPVLKYTIINDFSSASDNRFDAGAALGLGISCAITDMFGLSLEIRDYQSFVGTSRSGAVVNTFNLNNTCAVLLSFNVLL